MQVFPTLKNYKKEYLMKDLFAGVIVAAMSIPISMGYAEIAGLPAVYGLYGSILPILLFAMFSTSPQFIFGVDAAPAAIAGSLLVTLGIEAGSAEAIALIPCIALFVSLWLLLFYFLRAGKFLGYISTPVMGGFISGIAVTIILMQIPKLMGGKAGHGEVIELAAGIVAAAGKINALSFLLGIATLVIILASKKIAPKFPMAIVLMLFGALAEKTLTLSSYGVRLLSQVEPGLMTLSLPALPVTNLKEVMVNSLTIAVVIMAETLLAENNYAFKNGYKLKDNQEILACAMGNLGSAISGSCPVNGSVSRTAMGEQFGGKTQAMSLVAAGAMVLLLEFGTGFIGYLPVPVLTAIVISALMSVVETDLVRKLYRVNRLEFSIFMGAFLGVLVFGTIYGVVIGLALSFLNVVLEAAKPGRAWLGVVPGHEGFYDLGRNLHAKPVKNTLIYQFQGNLFFANIKIFMDDLEKAMTPEVHCIIVDASGINHIDVTAAENLRTFDQSLRKRHIRFYITEHTAQVNDQLRKLGLGDLIEKGMVRRTITAALKEFGLKKPYPLEGVEDETLLSLELRDAEEMDSLQEFVWAFGKDSEKQMEKNVQRILHSLDADSMKKITSENIGKLTHFWHKLSTFDETELLERLELHLSEIAKRLGVGEEEIVKHIEERKEYLENLLKEENPDAYQMLRQYEHELEEQMEKEHPKEYQHIQELKENR